MSACGEFVRGSTVPADASERIAAEIRRHVARNHLRPGDRLGTQQELAAEFGVSRPTLREGLRRLSSTHLIRTAAGPGGGIFVQSTLSEGMRRNLSESIATMLASHTVSRCRSPASPRATRPRRP